MVQGPKLHLSGGVPGRLLALSIQLDQTYFRAVFFL